MPHTSALDAAQALLDARARVLTQPLSRISRNWGTCSEGELLKGMASADRQDRPLLGLLLARALLQQAALSGSSRRLNNFLFRFGMHLKASVGTAGGSSAAVALAQAARVCLRRTTAAEQVSQLEDMLARLPEIRDKSDAWRGQLGLLKDEFEEHVQTVADAADADSRLLRRTAEVPRSAASRRPAPTAVVSGPATAPPAGARPAWLQLGEPRHDGRYSSAELTATRSWHLTDLGSPALNELREALFAAWDAYSVARPQDSAALLAPVLMSAGAAWAPTSSPDGLRLWNWLRLVSTHAAIDAGHLHNRRRALVSAVEAATRSLPEDEELVDGFVEAAVGDFVTAEPQARSAWATYLARLISTASSDLVLAHYDNARRAELRQAWSDHFGRLVEGCHQTHQMIDALSSEYRHAVQELYEVGRHPEPHRGLTRPLRRLRPFLDQEEADLASSVADSATRLGTLLAAEQPTAKELLEFLGSLEGLQDDIAASASVLLQDALGPVVGGLHALLSRQTDALSAASRPHLTATLETDRLPLSSSVVAPFHVKVAIRNDGNTTAELVEATLASPTLNFDSETQYLQEVSPGGLRSATWTGTAAEPSRQATIKCRLEWRDALERQFVEVVRLLAEDQRAPSWQADDVNPFTLGTISEPGRLVGRTAELGALERTVAGGGSAYVTGQKRVGKTSLVKVLQGSLRADGWLTAYLPLGVSLGETPRAADLLISILEALYDESLLVPGLTLPEPPVNTEGAQFARAVGRWLRQAQVPLGRSNVHALVALDDFDTLPATLYRGPVADALFRTLRTLVDSPWLSLVFIGSEVLPTILAAQAHQLNQVARLSLTNFSSPQDTRELLVTRTSDRLDWDERSFARAHFLCAGSPYYLTLLGRELWQHLRERDRSYVSLDDIAWSAQAVAQQGDLSHFLHLWADDPTGLDSESRRSLLGSAVLRATARASGPEFSFVDRTEAVALAAQWVPSGQAEEWNGAVEGLVNRCVLLNEERQVRLAIPLASSWLEGAGARELDRQYAAVESARVATQMITPREVVELTQDLTYAGDRVSDLRLRSWLDQFDDGRPRYLAFLLARRLLTEGFFSGSRLTGDILPAMAKAIKASAAWAVRQSDKDRYSRNIFVLQHGMAASSSFSTSSQLLALLRLRKANLVSEERFAEIAAKKTCALIVADDIVGTGTQLRRVVEQLVGTLDSKAQGWRETVHLVVAGGISAQRSLWTPEGTSAHSVVAHQAAPRLLAFAEDADLFSDSADREAARDLMNTIGGSLIPNHPLGFGELAMLAATEHNCPNNTLPVFWQRGTYRGREWLPLLERRV